jgi:hypothetical protein
MNVFHETLLLYLVPGATVGIVLSVWAGLRGHILLRLLCLLGGVLAVWAGLFFGVHMGYGAWQSIPDPPDEAFADGAKLTVALFFGWLPAGLLCVVTWALTLLLSRLLPLVRREA